MTITRSGEMEAITSLQDGDFVTTKFDIGLNPEIIKVVKQTSLSSINLKWGY